MGFSMMKAMLSLTLVSLVSSPAATQDATRREQADLRLTTRIVKLRYCDSGYPDMAQLRMSLQLTYVNAGQQPIILYRGSYLAQYVLISHNDQDARNKEYEVNQHVGWVTSGDPKVAEGIEPGDEFVVLTPGRSYRTEAEISTPVALGQGSQFLKSGKHVVQIVVDPWLGDDTQLERLRSKWKKSGFLWGSPVRSEPMPLEVDIEPKIVRCK